MKDDLIYMLTRISEDKRALVTTMIKGKYQYLAKTETIKEESYNSTVRLVFIEEGKKIRKAERKVIGSEVVLYGNVTTEGTLERTHVDFLSKINTSDLERKIYSH
jgi:hypothetical protein